MQVCARVRWQRGRPGTRAARRPSTGCAPVRDVVMGQGLGGVPRPAHRPTRMSTPASRGYPRLSMSSPGRRHRPAHHRRAGAVERQAVEHAGTGDVTKTSSAEVAEPVAQPPDGARPHPRPPTFDGSGPPDVAARAISVTSSTPGAWLPSGSALVPQGAHRPASAGVEVVPHPARRGGSPRPPGPSRTRSRASGRPSSADRRRSAGRRRTRAGDRAVRRRSPRTSARPGRHRARSGGSSRAPAGGRAGAPRGCGDLGSPARRFQQLDRRIADQGDHEMWVSCSKCGSSIVPPRQPRSARSAFRITATSITSCSRAPPSGGRYPRAATTIAAALRPIPPALSVGRS